MSLLVVLLAIGSGSGIASAGQLMPAPGSVLGDRPAFSPAQARSARSAPLAHTRMLPLDRFGTMVIDAVGQHVFISGDRSSSNTAIVVTDYTGATVTMIPGVPDVGGMAIGGSSLYVARCGSADVIDVFDLATFVKVESIAVDRVFPCDIEVAGDRLWYGGTNWKLTSMTLDATHTTVTHNGFTATELMTPSAAPDTLVAVSTGSPVYVATYDVSGGGLVATTPFTDLGVRAPAVAPDGATLFGVAQDDPWQVKGFSIPDLTMSTGFGSVPVARATAVSPDGGLVAVGAESETDGDLQVFQIGAAAPIWKMQLGPNADERADGVRFTPDGSALFVVYSRKTAAGLRLSVFPEPSKAPGDLTVTTGRPEVSYGAGVKVTAHLGTASTEKTVSIFREPAGGTRTLVASGTVDSAGNFSTVVVPKRNTTFTAEWGGDATYAPTVSAGRKVGVRLIMPAALSRVYGRSGKYKLVHYQASCGRTGAKCPVYAVGVKPAQPNDGLVFTLQQPRPSGGWATVAMLIVKTNSRSVAAVVFRYASAARGKAYRIHAYNSATESFARSKSAWTYFKITS